MSSAAFFRQPDVKKALKRAARAAATPVSVHFLSDGEESLRVASVGQCAACRHVAQMRGGPAACRASRTQATGIALRQRRAIPFVCHMGFSCVAVAALPGADLNYTLTFGPYCPSEAPQTFETDARLGFETLGEEMEDGALPVALDDIPLIPANVPPEIAVWTAEELARLWEEQNEDTIADSDEPAQPSSASRGRRRKRPTPSAEYQSDLLATALAMANQPLIRTHIEAAAAADEDLAVLRPRLVAAAAAALEKSAASGMDTARAWRALPETIGMMDRATTKEELVGHVTSLLGMLARQTRATREEDLLERLDGILRDRLPDTVRLNDVAEELGVHPTTITHRLQRNFGLSYSEYVGRLRVARAKELLRRTKLSIGDVARRVGISDPSNLAKLFARHEGISPADYRAKHARKK